MGKAYKDSLVYLEPIEHVYIHRETGKKCMEIWIGYFDKETCKFSKINLMYMKNEAKQLLELHKNNINK